MPSDLFRKGGGTKEDNFLVACGGSPPNRHNSGKGSVHLVKGLAFHLNRILLSTLCEDLF